MTEGLFGPGTYHVRMAGLQITDDPLRVEQSQRPLLEESPRGE